MQQGVSPGLTRHMKSGPIMEKLIDSAVALRNLSTFGVKILSSILSLSLFLGSVVWAACFPYCVKS